MGRIDDQQDQLEQQYAVHDAGLLAPIVNLAAPFIELAWPATGAMIGAVGIVADLMTRERGIQRLDVLYHGIRDSVDQQATSLERIRDELSRPVAQEAVITAVLQTLRTPRIEKIRRFGRILGAEFGSADSDWELATEIIRDLEEFSDRDLAVLEILWSVQAGAFVDGGMSTNSNDYVATWGQVEAAAAERGIDSDSLYGRIARLSGFGMTLEVRRTVSVQGPTRQFRLTGLAVRLIKALQVSNVEGGA